MTYAWDNIERTYMYAERIDRWAARVKADFSYTVATVAKVVGCFEVILDYFVHRRPTCFFLVLLLLLFYLFLNKHLSLHLPDRSGQKSHAFSPGLTLPNFLVQKARVHLTYGTMNRCPAAWHGLKECLCDCYLRCSPNDVKKKQSEFNSSV